MLNRHASWHFNHCIQDNLDMKCAYKTARRMEFVGMHVVADNCEGCDFYRLNREDSHSSRAIDDPLGASDACYFVTYAVILRSWSAALKLAPCGLSGADADTWWILRPNSFFSKTLVAANLSAAARPSSIKTRYDVDQPSRKRENLGLISRCLFCCQSRKALTLKYWSRRYAGSTWRTAADEILGTRGAERCPGELLE